MFDPNHFKVGEKAQDIQSQLALLLIIILKKTLKTLTESTTSLHNQNQTQLNSKMEPEKLSPKQESSQPKSMPVFPAPPPQQESSQPKSMPVFPAPPPQQESSQPKPSQSTRENKQSDLEKTFDETLRQKLVNLGVSEPDDKIQKFRSGNAILFADSQESINFNTALKETSNIFSPPLVEQSSPPPPIQQADTQQPSVQQPPSPPPIQSNKNQQNLNSTLQSLGFSPDQIKQVNQSIDQIKQQSQQLDNPTSSQPIIIIISDRLEKANAGDKLKNFFKDLGNSVKRGITQGIDNIKNSIPNTPNVNQAITQGIQNIKNSIPNNQNRKNVQQDLNNAKAFMISSRLLDKLGSVQDNGKRVFENQSYKIEADANNSRDNLQLTDKSKGTIILTNQNDSQNIGKLRGNVTRKNSQDLLNLNKALNSAIIETGVNLQQRQLSQNTQSSKAQTSQLER